LEIFSSVCTCSISHHNCKKRFLRFFILIVFFRFLKLFLIFQFELALVRVRLVLRCLRKRQRFAAGAAADYDNDE